MDLNSPFLLFHYQKAFPFLLFFPSCSGILAVPGEPGGLDVLGTAVATQEVMSLSHYCTAVLLDRSFTPFVYYINGRCWAEKNSGHHVGSIEDDTWCILICYKWSQAISRIMCNVLVRAWGKARLLLGGLTNNAERSWFSEISEAVIKFLCHTWIVSIGSQSGIT